MSLGDATTSSRPVDRVADQRPPVIGLMGAPGSGKSYYAAALAVQGAVVIDADELAREVYESPAVKEQVLQRWGSGLLAESGKLDRRALGVIVFEDPKELAALEGMIHPAVHVRRRELHRRYRATAGVTAIVEDCPLLLEQGIDEGCDVLVFIETPRELRLQRVKRTRGWDEAELNRREKNQWSLDSKRRRADYVLPGDVAPSDVANHVCRLLRQIPANSSQVEPDPLPPPPVAG